MKGGGAKPPPLKHSLPFSHYCTLIRIEVLLLAGEKFSGRATETVVCPEALGVKVELAVSLPGAIVTGLITVPIAGVLLVTATDTLDPP